MKEQASPLAIVIAILVLVVVFVVVWKLTFGKAKPEQQQPPMGMMNGMPGAGGQMPGMPGAPGAPVPSGGGAAPSR